MTFTLLLILLIRFSTVAAQPPAAPPPYTFNPSVATIIVIVISAVLFIVFFTLYLRLCSSASSANPLLAAATSLRRRSPGLDATTVASFPVFHYHEVKELKMGKNALECAICLNEFEDDETLRLLPSCDHVFHPECIDAWLESHVTCPVCRANLLPGSSEKPLPESPPPPMSESISDDSMSVSAQILPDQSIGKHTGLFGKSVRLRETYEKSMGKRTGLFGKFPRSHSTGHSLVVVRPGEDTDRFTLRFPEHVRKEVLTRALIRTATFNITTEGSSRRSRRGGEGSSLGARSYKRLDRAVKSDRWVITVPFFSGKAMGDEREGSIGRGKVTAVKLPSFKCLEPGASGDAYSVGQARPAV